MSNTEEMRKMKARLLALAFGFLLAAGTAQAGPTPGGTDSDSDGVENAFDNCTAVSNTAQTDTDHNGCGNACTPPCNFVNDTIIGAPDKAVIGANYGMTGMAGIPGDCGGTTPCVPDGTVGAPDLACLGSVYLDVVGPSGITSAQCNTASCLCTPNP